MKKLLFAVCMLFGVAVAVNAQDTTSTQNEPSTDYRTQEDPNDEMGQDESTQDTETGVYQDTEAGQDTDTDVNQDTETDVNQSTDTEINQDTEAGQDTETGVNQDIETSQDTDTDVSTQDPSVTGQDTEGASRDEDIQVVAVSDLPAIVRQSLESQEYSGWTVSEAYKKEKDGKVFYKVKMQNGAETKKVKFDEQGNKIKEMDGDDKDHKDHQ